MWNVYVKRIFLPIEKTRTRNNYTFRKLILGLWKIKGRLRRQELAEKGCFSAFEM